MSTEGPAAGPLADAILAIQLLTLVPRELGGIRLRGSGPARDLVLEQLRATISEETPWRRLPGHIDDDALLGGIDLAASLAAGKPVKQTGLLAEAAGGYVCAPMAERMRDELAGRVAQAIDEASGDASFALVLLDDGAAPDELSPANLCDRVAFHCDLSGVRSLDVEREDYSSAIPLTEVSQLDEEALSTLAHIATALGVDSVRALVFALQTARAHAALRGSKTVEQEDLAVAARLVLGPRATQIPQMEPEEEQDPPPPETQNSETSQDNLESEGDIEAIPEDVILEAVLASLPDDVLAAIASGRVQRRGWGGGSGKRTRSKLRGKPLGSRPGMPRGGARLALIDSLRAAAPWQPVRRRDEPDADRAVLVHKDDLRVRRFEERSATVTVFCVDASGSAAAARLAEAKGAVELILAQAYVKRSEVALLAFRGEGAEVLLPPTRSLTRARRALAGLPGGGGTPLASGIAAGLQLSQSIASRGHTPFLVFLTDGSANIAADGTPGRGQAREDAEAAAKRVAASGVEALLIDISPRPRRDAESIARLMHARYLPLPMADAKALERAVTAAQPQMAKA